MAPGVRAVASAVGILLAVSTAARALPPGSAGAGEALALCETADEHPASERVAMFERGLALAEAAVERSDADALGHFALFCNLGRRLRVVGPSIVRPFEMLRAVQALERAVVLAPDDPDVMTAKGALLLELPEFLGGDAERGESWLRRALAVDPEHRLARRYLDDVRARRGADSDAPARRATR